MLHVNKLFSMMFFAGLALSGCSVESQPADESDERSTGDGPVKPEPKPDLSKGRLGLKMPKQGDLPYRTLEITLSQTTCSTKPVPEPMPYPVDEPVDANEGLYEEAYDDDVSWQDGECYATATRTERFAFKNDDPDMVAIIDDLVPGGYDVTVTLYDENDKALEQGYGWAEVMPGRLNLSTIEIYPVEGEGGLVIDVIRGGERVQDAVSSEPAAE
jgi:hypothetical protein